ncbi:cutinase [Frankineae bacterium MT45]|nr:cutinase [Frankineae bacterium MT45]
MHISRMGRRLIAGLGCVAVAAAAAVGVGGGEGAGAVTATAATCTPAKLIVARGTFEIGTLGFIVGDTLISNLNKKGPGVFSSEAIDYPANIDTQSPVKGDQAEVAQVTAAVAACPNQKIVLSGYSQGAQIVDEALGYDMTGTINGGKPTAVFSDAVISHISAIVLFGNPLGSIGKHIVGPLASRTKEYCADGDPVCQPNQINIFAHLSYFTQTEDAANFIISKL